MPVTSEHQMETLEAGVSMLSNLATTSPPGFVCSGTALEIHKMAKRNNINSILLKLVKANTVTSVTSTCNKELDGLSDTPINGSTPAHNVNITDADTNVCTPVQIVNITDGNTNSVTFHQNANVMSPGYISHTASQIAHPDTDACFEEALKLPELRSSNGIAGGQHLADVDGSSESITNGLMSDKNANFTSSPDYIPHTASQISSPATNFIFGEASKLPERQRYNGILGGQHVSAKSNRKKVKVEMTDAAYYCSTPQNPETPEGRNGYSDSQISNCSPAMSGTDLLTMNGPVSPPPHLNLLNTYENRSMRPIQTDPVNNIQLKTEFNEDNPPAFCMDTSTNTSPQDTPFTLVTGLPVLFPLGNIFFGDLQTSTPSPLGIQPFDQNDFPTPSRKRDSDGGATPSRKRRRTKTIKAAVPLDVVSGPQTPVGPFICFLCQYTG